MDAELAGYRQYSTCAIHSNDNDLWKTFLLRFESAFSRFPFPTTGDVATLVAACDNCLPHGPMHLVSCDSPREPLEDAPRSGLVADLTEGEQWDGFWASDSDAYFVRCTRASGETEWFKLADDDAPNAANSQRGVLPLRPKAQLRVNVVVAQSPDGRRMLVGSARRTTRP